MYNQEPLLPVNLIYGLNSEPASSYDGPIGQDMFEAVFASVNTISGNIHEAAWRSIKRHRKNRNAILTSAPVLNKC